MSGNDHPNHHRNNEVLEEEARGANTSTCLSQDCIRRENERPLLTSQVQTTCNLPKRLEHPHWFSGYGCQDTKQHPFYRTTSSDYGWYPPDEHQQQQHLTGPSVSSNSAVLCTLQEEEPNPENDMPQHIKKVVEKSGLDNLKILSDNPTARLEYGKDIHPEIAARFNQIVTNGINKDTRQELCEKYLLPGNCTIIGAPTLNTELKVTLNETTLRRDKLIEHRQRRLAAAISCLGEALSYALEAKEKDNEQIKRLMDTACLMCDIQYNDSLSRRNLVVSSLEQEIKAPLHKTTIDSYLFGENLLDFLKTAKAVKKSVTELKQQIKPAVPTKNWRAPVTIDRRALATPMTVTQPAPPQTTDLRTTRTLSLYRPPLPSKSTRRRYTRPGAHSVPSVYCPKQQRFTNFLAKSGMYRNYSLNTTPEQNMFGNI